MTNEQWITPGLMILRKVHQIEENVSSSGFLSGFLIGFRFLCTRTVTSFPNPLFQFLYQDGQGVRRGVLRFFECRSSLLTHYLLIMGEPRDPSPAARYLPVPTQVCTRTEPEIQKEILKEIQRLHVFRPVQLILFFSFWRREVGECEGFNVVYVCICVCVCAWQILCLSVSVLCFSLFPFPLPLTHAQCNITIAECSILCFYESCVFLLCV